MMVARAERYALLVGVGTYNSRVIPKLEGPMPDVLAMRMKLESKWGFARHNIVELVDARATKAAILAALDVFADRLNPGDTGLFYFSGHGTSAYDKALRDRATVFSPESGALVPYDARVGTHAEVANSLILGNRDIRPRLSRVVSKATVLVVFDSCYSGSSAKSAISLPSRGIPLRDLIAEDVTDSDLRVFSGSARSSPVGEKGGLKSLWPYTNVLYISAASKTEKAVDISSAILNQFPTEDGRPHGALTSRILAGLNGESDTNHDGMITYEELYRYTKLNVANRFPHTPQFESPGQTFAEAPLFGAIRAPVSPTRVSKPNLTRVRLDNAPISLQEKIRQIKGVQLSGAAFDLFVRSGSSGGIDLFHSSYDQILRFSPREESELLARIGHHGAIQALVNLEYPQQSFNVSLELQRVAGGSGESEFYMDDTVRMVVSSERACYMLALNIDTVGNVTLLYAGDRPVKYRDAQFGPTLSITGPLGLEYIKIFAFQEKPVGFDHWASRSGITITPESQDFRDLMSFLQGASPRASEYTTKLLTARRP